MIDDKNIRKKLLVGSVSLISIIVLIFGAIGPSLFVTQVSTDDAPINVTVINWDIIVPDDYADIQEAVRHASSGDWIFVKSGTYYARRFYTSQALLIDVPDLTIRGEHRNSTIITGRDRSDGVVIKADGVNFSGFSLKDNEINGSLLKLYGSHCQIWDNNFDVNNFYNGNEYGVRFYNADENVFSYNHVINGDRAIDLVGSDYNRFIGNIVEKNYQAVDVDEMYMIDFTQRMTKKIFKQPCEGNRFEDNIFRENTHGVILDGSIDDVFINNTFELNSRNGLVLSNCLNNKILRNKFIENGFEIWGTELEHYVHEIGGNTVNGKPLYYYRGNYNIEVPKNAGQIILVDCENTYIKYVKISNTSTAVLTAFCEDTTIYDSDFRNNYRGVYFYYSTKNKVKYNNFINNRIHASFVIKGFLNSKKNIWGRNYWKNILELPIPLGKGIPQKITGVYHLQRPFKSEEKIKIGFLTKNYDWLPVRRPYTL